MALMCPSPDMLATFNSHKTRRASRAGPKLEKLTPGEAQILEDDTLEGFRKYIHNENLIVERVDEFEKYYAAKFPLSSEQAVSSKIIKLNKYLSIHFLLG